MSLTAGAAEGATELNAFDNALLSAKIGNVNLIKVSSIAPPGVEIIDLPKLTPGALTPTAYATITSNIPGEVISAAVAVGIYKPEHFGVIMEYSARCTAKEAEEQVKAMVEEGFKVRGLTLNSIKTITIQHKVTKIGSVIAAAVLLY
jgi:arginine decarboxylase